MATKKRGLGRGLDALLGNANLASVNASEADADGQLLNLPVDVIQRGQYQPRTEIDNDSLEELVDSIRAQGIVQPIVVRPISSNRYEIIAGERRWRSAQLAGLHNVPAIVRDVSDQSAMAMALIENIQREDLNPLDEALALKRLITEFELTHQMAAEAVGRSRAAVSNLLRLFELNDDVKDYVQSRQMEMGHARALLGIMGAAQSKAAREVVSKGLSVRETERLVKRLQSSDGVVSKKQNQRLDPNVVKLQEDLSERLGAGVSLQHGAKGKGRLVIHYNSLEELDGILAHIK